MATDTMGSCGNGTVATPGYPILEAQQTDSWTPSESSGIVVHRLLITAPAGSVSESSGRLSQSHPSSDSEPRHLNGLPMKWPPMPESVLTSTIHIQEDKLGQQRRHEFGAECLVRLRASPTPKLEVLVFVPTQPGHLVRSDILDIRLADSLHLEGFVGFASNNASSFTGDESKNLPRHLGGILDAAIGACFTRGTSTSTSTSTSSSTSTSPRVRHDAGEDTGVLPLYRDLAERLSIPLVHQPDHHHHHIGNESPSLSNTPRRRTIAILECGKSPASGLGIFQAAKALDLCVLALDKPGHWISSDEYASWRDAFIAVDRNPDEGLPDRLLAAIGSYGKTVDGIVSFFDPLLSSTAAVAAKLGLPTGPVDAFAVASDKFMTSRFEGHRAYRVSSAEQALACVHRDNHGEQGAMRYPLVVKPCSGWGSEGVYRAENDGELVLAVESIDSARHGSDVAIEEYCAGPEVDANLVLCDGELLFFEASDDFPKGADKLDDGRGAVAGRQEQQKTTTFIEEANVLPSALPADELDMLKSSLYQSLLRLGFRSGFFHLEARVENSRARYQRDATSCYQDLVIIKPSAEEEDEDEASKSGGAAAAAAQQQQPSAWLLEINARPPGLQASWASRATYGIDYWGLALCFALGDKTRARALSVPFVNRHQYWCQIVFIPVTKGGVFQSGDVCRELLGRRPDLAGHISRCHCFFVRGDMVPDPATSGILTWVAYYLVISRTSRSEVLEISEVVRRETRFVIETNGHV